MSEWEWIDDPDPEAPDSVGRALAADGHRVLRHGEVSVQLADRDTGSPPDYSVCAVPHLGWRRYSVVALTQGEETRPFDYLESQAFPVLDGGADADAGRHATVEGARQFGLDLLDDAHGLLHEAEPDSQA
jgi:hypothetical protein